jgi:hypothetical protein
MKILSDFFNKVAKEIDTTYFKDVKYYRDNKECTNIHYALELFNNGCITYNRLINLIAKNTKDTKENIKKIVDKFVE